eukprot:TRINITY_DN4068_c0_g1_i1.p1 TRINITY_DN4068_c0_g1~~TRINITY_DN4068_c0_g1_i1.p1  ORF type:complete len:257 (-),score=55.52 TRINITY_DN4068_c0_g1_i1:36-719(-)
MNTTPQGFDLKLVLLGRQCSGKSSFCNRVLNDTFSSSYVPTIGIDIGVRQIEVEDNDQAMAANVQFWDAAGDVRFKNLLFSYCHYSHGAVIFFDCTDRASFEEVAEWITFFRTHCRLPQAANQKLMMIGTKSLSPLRVIPSAEAIKFALDNDLFYAECDSQSTRQRTATALLEPLVASMVERYNVFDDTMLNLRHPKQLDEKPSVFAPVRDAWTSFVDRYWCVPTRR